MRNYPLIKIGDLLLLQSHTLLIPKGETVNMELRFEEDDHNEPLLMSLKFTEDEPNKESKERPKSGLTITGEEKRAEITFLNWNKPFGSSIQKPISFAETAEGEELFLMANARSSGDVYELIIQFLKGGSK